MKYGVYSKVDMNEVPDATLQERVASIEKDAGEGGYFLNPDTAFVRNLVRGLIVNEMRFGYPSCPCRLGTGKKADDLDIICPCDYRDPDLDQYGACYCALYVSPSIHRGEAHAGPVPERRPPRSQRGLKTGEHPSPGIRATLPYPIWRCRVCGYLCARSEPPHLCPICKAGKDRFEKFME